MSSSPVVSARPSLAAVSGRAFLITGAVGRLPASTLQLGLLLFITGSGLGFGLGGLTVAAVGIGTAFGAPIVGRLVDKVGAFPVVAAALLFQTVGLLAIIAAVVFAPQPLFILASAVVIGAANPQIGPIARGRWSTLARERRDPDLIRYAMGYEGACDEAGFVIGPVLAGLIVGLMGPATALLVLLALTWVGEGVFIAYLWAHRAEWRKDASQVTDAVAFDRLDPVMLVWPLAACLAVGMVFGSTQTALTAVNTAAGTPASTGLIYGCVGLGSAIVSFLIVRLTGVSLGTRIALGGALIALASSAMMVARGPIVTSGIAVLLGAAVGAVIVSAFARVEQVAPAARINTAMTLGSTCLTLGVSIGAATSGVLVAVPSQGFWPAIIAGLGALAAGALMLAPDRTTIVT